MYLKAPFFANSVLTKVFLPARPISHHLRSERMGQLVSRAKGNGSAGQQAEPDMWLVVGLGNPGSRYERTRHNVGFMAIDALARMYDIRTDRLQENCAVGRGRLADQKIMLAKPLTFMNNSGEGIGRLCRYYGLSPQRILVIYDDLDMPTATVRLRAKGGHGGHNGVRSLIAHLGTNEFPRVKIGIGRPPEGVAVPSYVLQEFAKVELDAIDGAVREAIEVVRASVMLGIERAVSGTRVDASGKPIAPVTAKSGNTAKPKKEKLQEGTSTIAGTTTPVSFRES